MVSLGHNELKRKPRTAIMYWIQFIKCFTWTKEPRFFAWTKPLEESPYYCHFLPNTNLTQIIVDKHTTLRDLIQTCGLCDADRMTHMESYACTGDKQVSTAKIWLMDMLFGKFVYPVMIRQMDSRRGRQTKIHLRYKCFHQNGTWHTKAWTKRLTFCRQHLL